MVWNIFRLRMAGAQFGDRIAAAFGVGVAMMVTITLCEVLWDGTPDLPAIAAPLAASAAMAFVIPSSPLAQPWRIIGGNVISALVGVTAFHAVQSMAVAAGLAVGLAILVMSLARCFHPPGAAIALIAVIGGPAVRSAGYGFAFVPVAVNSVIVVLLAIGFHRFTNHTFPHRAQLAGWDFEQERSAAAFEPQDIDAALADLDETFDISRQDLELLLFRAEVHAARRRSS